MPRPEIPESVDALTPEWLSAGLAECMRLGPARVRSVSHERIGAGEGLIGDVHRLRLDVEPETSGLPRTLIAKFPVLLPATRAMAELLGAYEREILFYRELAAKLPVRIPRCYLGRMDPRRGTPEADERARRFANAAPFWVLRLLLPLARMAARRSRRRYVLLLEDMAPARAGDQMAGCSREELRAAVESLARLHAGFWESPELMRHPWLQSLDSAARVFQHEYLRARRAFEAQYGDRVPEAVRPVLEWLEREGETLLRRFGVRRPTLLHGDYRIDNLFFDRDEDGAMRVSIIDWQSPARGPGVYDLAYLLTSSIPEEDAARTAELLDVYRAGLERAGVDYPRDELLRDYREALLLIVHRICTASVSVEAPQTRSRVLIETWVARTLGHVASSDFRDLI